MTRDELMPYVLAGLLIMAGFFYAYAAYQDVKQILREKREQR